MRTPFKHLIAAGFIASFSLNSIADTNMEKEREAVSKDTQSSTPEKDMEFRKQLHDHAKNNLKPDELKAMHHKVKKQMQDSSSAKSASAVPAQSPEFRKQLHDHAKNNLKPDELKAMHQKVKEQMENK